ncbi:MAG: hypothetical protein ACPGGA_04445 [Balneolaceae bacterium]
MSTEIILIIIGAVFTLIAIFDFMSVKVRIPLGMFGIILIIYGGYSYGAINLQGQIEQVEVATVKDVVYPVNRVQIISPIMGDAIDCRTLTMGVYPEGHSKDIWVLLMPSDELYYPQSDHTNTSFKRNGEFQVITRFGGDALENYDIIVYETNENASAFFTQTIEEWKAALEYPGLTEDQIPAGAIEVDRITVSLIENCRGVF